MPWLAGCSPAEITWRAGRLSFERLKMVLWQLKPWFFNQSLAETFSYRRKRSGHLFSAVCRRSWKLT